MAQLTETLQKYPLFKELTLDKQHVLLTLAQEFEDNDLALYLSPQELQQKLTGTKEHWELLLGLEPTKNYIKKAMAERTQIAHRKAFAALQAQAQQGNVQAAKQIQELAGITQDTNRTVILHRVDRPKPKQEETKQ